MPITILNKKYTDLFGNQTTYWECNAGDPVTVEYKVIEQIFVVSGAQNFFAFDFVNDTITWAGGDWLKEGLRVGEIYQIRKFDNTGTAVLITSATLINVSGAGNSIAKFNTLNPSLAPDLTLGQTVGVMGFSDSTDYRKEEIIVTVNQVQTGSAGSPNSPIDGEVTKFKFNIKDVPGFPNPAGGTIIQGVPVGKQSGQFATKCELEFSDETPAQAGFYINIGSVYYIRFTTINAGVYLQTQFNLDKCLKLYSQIEGVRLFGEPFNHSLNVVNDDANTGWFDEAYNVGTIDAVLVQGIGEIAYDAPTQGVFIIETTAPINDYGIGASYIPGDETYYKNQNPNQSVFGITLPTTTGAQFVGGPATSETNPTGANFTLEILLVTNVGNVYTVEYLITPNPQFTDFMETREPGDRLFRVWAKFLSVNLLVYNDQLTSNPPIGGPLTLKVADYYDHSQNIIDLPSVLHSGYESNTEDDLAFCGGFLLPEYTNVSSFTARIEAVNSATNETFTLFQTFFNFNSVPIVGGKYVLNLTAPVISILPNTSVKRDALLFLEPSLDDPGNVYGVKIYFPFLNRWEYWLDQTNADNDFYPNNQTKNWVPYQTGDWRIGLHLEAVIDDLAYIYDDKLRIKDYDSDPNIFQEIELYVDATNQNVGIVTIGQLMRVVATHTLVNGQAWDGNVWGQITVEPFESSTRYLLSTAINTDFDANNPLEPLTGAIMPITYPAPNVARMECYFDPSKLNLQNGCKFTTKIKGCSKVFKGKEKADGTPKEKTDGTIKVKS